MTLNDKVLDDARLLELRFGGKILTPQQAMEESEREEAEKQAAEKEAMEKEGSE